MNGALAGVGDEPAPGRPHVDTPKAGVDPWARAVFAALVVACLAAFLITQRLKHTPTAVQEFDFTPLFSPYPSRHLREAQISFKLEHAEAVTVTIVNSAGDMVATLVRDRPLARYKTFSLRWNGRRGSARRFLLTYSPHGLPILEPVNEGAIAPAGEYRVRIGLSHHSPVYSIRTITLVGP
ncbi:MAG TPA: hypothetical protein VED41_03885 [Solirubrobacteraceae bacterium]|nr:hypothetical protein [Solirubrobacteraceae bacterium]